MTSTDTTTRQWLDEMVVELRLRDVRGDAIGDAVAAVESHVADSGETPAEAFGDPRAYVRSLEFPAAAVHHHDGTDWLRMLAPTAAGLVGVYPVPGIVGALAGHTSVAVRWGELAALALLAVICLVLVRVPGVLRAVLHRPVTAVLVLGGAITVLTLLQVLLDGVALRVPAWLAVVVAVAALAASVVGLRRQVTTDDDPVVDPRTGRRTSPALATATSWVFVAAAAGLGLVSAIPLLLA